MSEPPFPPPPSPPVDYAASRGDEERTWAMACHLASLAGYAVGFGQIVGPLVVWLIKRDQHPFVDDQGKESINFQITTYLAAFACSLTACLVITVPIVIVLLVAIAVGHLVLTVIATVEAYKGRPYRYPVNWRLIK